MDSAYNLSSDEEKLARSLFFDLGRDETMALEEYLRSPTSNSDVRRYRERLELKHGGKACRGRKAAGSAETQAR